MIICGYPFTNPKKNVKIKEKSGGNGYGKYTIKQKRYTNYQDYTLMFDTETYQYEAYYKKEKYAEGKIEGFYKNGEKETDFSEFAYTKISQNYSKLKNSAISIRFFDHTPEFDEWNVTESKPVYTLNVNATAKNIFVDVIGDAEVKVTGVVLHAPEDKDDVFAVSFDRDVTDVRSGIGPAISTIDNAIYNRKLDKAVVAGKPKKTKSVMISQRMNTAFLVGYQRKNHMKYVSGKTSLRTNI